jgi:hypothetical protein
MKAHSDNWACLKYENLTLDFNVDNGGSCNWDFGARFPQNPPARKSSPERSTVLKGFRIELSPFPGLGNSQGREFVQYDRFKNR